MSNSIKNFLLESEAEKDDNFAYFDKDIVSKIIDVDFNSKDNAVSIKFSTTYNKNFNFVSKLSDFKKWLSEYLKSHEEKSPNVFYNYLSSFFENSKEQPEEDLNEIIDDTNEIMPDKDLPSNASNTMIGTQQTMDSEKVFKRSMPKSVRNYSGNLGLGTVTW